MSGWLKIYWLVGGTWLGMLAFNTLTGHENDWDARHTLPGNVRNSPGGLRSFHFWHSGFSGGK